jgi:O-antigen ligase
VLYNNYYIAKENFKRNPLFGTGLGSHPIAFDKYSLTKSSDVIQITFNKADANSMFLRLLSETGLYGVIFIIYFLVRHYFWRGKSADDENWIISNALAIIIILYLLRQGHYFLNGFPFFLWLYYYTWKINREERKKLAEEQPDANNQPQTLLNEG